MTAWVRWSADRRDLGEAGTEALTEQVPRVLARFGQAYDDPDAVVVRGYASGLAASDADVSWLSDNVGRRMFALPIRSGTLRWTSRTRLTAAVSSRPSSARAPRPPA